MKHIRYVLYSETLGVYLGSFLGMGFWSRLDSAGQTSACVFNDSSEGLKWAMTWETPVSDLTSVEVKTERCDEATLEECAAAGLRVF